MLNLSSWCLVIVEWLFLAVPWGCLRFVIVVFPDHTHLLFLLLLACDDRHYGINCTLKCGNCFENATCNKTTGDCFGGCSAGWKSPLCNESRYNV